MQYRTLGRTGLDVSLMSYGSGGPSRLGQGTGLSDTEQEALVRRCIDLGVNLIDSSANYGRSEEILGRCLRDVPRDAYYMATKWSPRADGVVKTDPEDLPRSVDESLRRLGIDVIDVMQFHGVTPDIYDEVVDRHFGTMRRLQEAGKIRYVGITEMFFQDADHSMLTRALTEHPDHWDTVMLKYGILNQYAAKETLPLAERHNVGVMNMASVRVKLTRAEELEALMLEWAERGLISADALDAENPLAWLVDGPVDSVISAGYRFAADHPAISTVITGTSRIPNLETNHAALADPTLPDAAKERLRELFGELAEGA
jgi:aryl-alcohol dehydrogenase-like predicted oxidoreductase